MFPIWKTSAHPRPTGVIVKAATSQDGKLTKIFQSSKIGRKWFSHDLFLNNSVLRRVKLMWGCLLCILPPAGLCWKIPYSSIKNCLLSFLDNYCCSGWDESLHVGMNESELWSSSILFTHFERHNVCACRHFANESTIFVNSIRNSLCLQIPINPVCTVPLVLCSTTTMLISVLVIYLFTLSNYLNNHPLFDVVKREIVMKNLLHHLQPAALLSSLLYSHCDGLLSAHTAVTICLLCHSSFVSLCLCVSTRCYWYFHCELAPKWA